MPLKVLLCTAGEHFGRSTKMLLERVGLSVRFCMDLAEVVPAIHVERPDLLVCGWRFGPTTSWSTLQLVEDQFPEVAVLVWSGSVSDVELPWPRLQKPCRLSRAMQAFQSAVELRASEKNG